MDRIKVNKRDVNQILYKAYKREFKQLLDFVKPLLVSSYDSFELLDGSYEKYMVLKNKGIKFAEVMTVPDYAIGAYYSFVLGKFEGSNKVYVWYNPTGMEYSIGDKVLVQTYDPDKQIETYAQVTVSSMFHSKNANLTRIHKRVISNKPIELDGLI